MKPYIAVLYDSFVESVRSKVLWILLAAWTLILGALFPLAITEGESYQFSFADVANPKVMMDQLAAASAGKGTRAQRAVYAQIDKDFQEVLQQRQKNQRRIAVGLLIRSLNNVLSSEKLYDKQAWPTAERRNELKPLIEKESLSASEREKLNRNLIDLAFPGATKKASGQAAWITYAGLKLGGALPLTERQLRPFIETLIFPLVMRLGLGIVAMFVAIIITSPMIPDMFQPGSLHLLLSKPLSRSYLFLTKFLGGCIFVGINILYLLVGLYLYAGTRLGIWNEGILWCIPLFIFVFMIFYSVSALVGLVWKNAIICVVVTACFWGVCFGVGLIHFYFDVFLHIQPQTKNVVSIGDSLITTTQQGRVMIWNKDSNRWETAYGEMDGQRVLGPVWVEDQKSIYFSRSINLPFGMPSGDNTPISIAHVPDLMDPSDKSFPSKPWEDARLDSGVDLPNDALQIQPWKNSFVVLSSEGIHRFDAELASKSEQQSVSILGFNLGGATASSAYPLMTPKDWGLQKPLDLGVAPSADRFATYSRGKVILWKLEGNVLKESGTVELETAPETVAIVGVNAEYCIVCPNAAKPVVIDVAAATIHRTMDEVGEVSVRQIKVAADGQFAMLTADGEVWVADAKGAKAVKPNLAGQGHGLAISYDTAGMLWLVHHVHQADKWDVAGNKSVASVRPTPGIAERIYDYVINPFYIANPKPAAVNDTIEYVLKKPDNKTIAIDRNDLDQATLKVDPWRPLWSNSIFIAVMLAVSCWYLYRQDL